MKYLVIVLFVGVALAAPSENKRGKSLTYCFVNISHEFLIQIKTPYVK